MHKALASEVLASAVSEVLETMFFSCVYAEMPGAATGERIEARVRFTGQWSGEFCLGISPEAAREIAAGFLGLEEESEIDPARVGDVVSEVANMVCGAVLSRLGADSVFDLQPPRLTEPGRTACTGECELRTFDLGNGTLTAGIHFERS